MNAVSSHFVRSCSSVVIWKKPVQLMRVLFSHSILLSTLAVATPTLATPITLQQATATYSQEGYSSRFDVDKAIDGNIPPPGVQNGWAIDPNESAQTAVFETALGTETAVGTLTFTLNQNFGSPDHNLGKFRLSATTDNRDNFADGLVIDGDVIANWVVLDPVTMSAIGATLTEETDHSILASGDNLTTEIYTITTSTMSLINISGFRLEVLEDASLPHNGPGRQANNGNFVLTEFSVDYTPSPDDDGDGVNDENDRCPDSASTVVDELGCTILQLCPCGGFKNHGQVLSCTLRAVEDFIQLTLISKEDGKAIISSKAKSSCGKKKK